MEILREKKLKWVFVQRREGRRAKLRFRKI
jgi:hypothetical protein